MTIKSVVFLIIAAFFTSLGVPNFFMPLGVPFTCFIGVIVFLRYLNKDISLKEKYKYYLIFSYTFFSFSFHWIFYTIYNFGGLPIVISILLGLIFAIFVFPQFAIYILFTKLRLPIFYKNLLGALLLTTIERIIYPLFPFSLGEMVLNLSPYIGLIRIFGSIGFSFIFYYLFLVIASKEYSFCNLILIIAFVILNICFPLTITKGVNTKIKLVQGNINNLEFLADKDFIVGRRDILNTYANLSFDDEKIDLIVWPESAYPYAIDVEDASDMIPLRTLSSKTGAKFVVGATRESASGIYNSLISSDGEFYDKQILVPFGEYIPFFGDSLDDILGISPFTAGKSFPLFKMKNGQSFIAAICYEVLFPTLIRKYLTKVESPSFLVTVANDDWYGNTGQRQEHRYFAHLRSVEFNIPIVRVTNTGISQILYPDGTMSEAINANESGAITLDLDIIHNSTIFERYYFIPTIILILCLIVCFYLEKIIRLQCMNSKDIY